MAAEVLPTQDELMRRALFTPCETKEALARWIRVYLNLSLPDCTVSEESNSSPMDLIWELYDKARRNDDEEFSRVMAYANRGGFKTLGAAILEVLMVIHLRRNVAHMAAIFDQSKKSQEYTKNFFNKPYIRDFKVGDNVKMIQMARYYNPNTGKSLTSDEFHALIPEHRNQFVTITNYVQIVLCTMAGANSAHTEFMCVDEVDVVPKQNKPAYEQAKHIPDPRDGMLPITLLTSTRKTNHGLVQRELDHARDTGLHVKHWNVIDITKPCEPERHKPDEPKVNLYINEITLRHISEADYELLDEMSKSKFEKREGFAGCAKCALFTACKGRLATHQKSKSPMLKPIPAIINAFKQSTAEAVTTELLCRKPDATGLIYAKLNREVHLKEPWQVAEMMTGEEFPHSLSKPDLLQLMFDKGARFYSGMDFGFAHNFAAILGAVFGQYCFVLSVITMPNLELDEKIAVCEPFRRFEPTVFGDPEAPADIKTFKRKGFNMREWDKYPGSVKAGIEIVRMKLQPALGSPQLYFIKDDPGCELLVDRMLKYHFLTDVAGQISDEPDDEDDDECDALRYMVMNIFAPKGKVVLPKTPEPPTVKETVAVATSHMSPGKEADWMKQKIASLVGEGGEGAVEPTSIKKGKFRFDG